MSQTARLSARDKHESGTLAAAPPASGDWDNLEKLLEDLPPGIPILPPEDAFNFDKYTNRPPYISGEGDGWNNCARALEKYDAELCKGYREEIDTLLVFAGLFSAVVTAFTIESYQWLQTDSNDAIVVLLSQIAQSVSPNTSAASSVSAETGLPVSVSFRINIYWFLALSLSLSAALVAILCKQWIREFERNAPTAPRYFVPIHHTKLEGFENWRVGGIIVLLPLLLQFALALFALGILELLWQLNSTVAAVVCVPTIVAFLFYAATTLLPVLQYQRLEQRGRLSLWQTLSACPYKSPQAMLAFRARDIVLWIGTTCSWASAYVYYLLSRVHYSLLSRFRPRNTARGPFMAKVFVPLSVRVPSWAYLDGQVNHRLDTAFDEADCPLPRSSFRSLRWIMQNLDYSILQRWIWHCLWESAAWPYRPNSLERGLYHVFCGANTVPKSGPRALVLGHLAVTDAPHMFVIEAFVQNLISMDPASAEHITEWMLERDGLRLDQDATATVLRAAAAFTRLHSQEAIGKALFYITKFVIYRADAQLRGRIYDYTLTLVHIWLRTYPGPHSASTADAVGDIVAIHCEPLLEDAADYCAYPERLRQRPRVLELAQLVKGYAQMRSSVGHLTRETSGAAAADIVDVIYRYRGLGDSPASLMRGLIDLALEEDGTQSPRGDGAALPRASSASLPETYAPPQGVLPTAAQSGDLPQDPDTTGKAPSQSWSRAASLARTARHDGPPDSSAQLRESVKPATHGIAPPALGPTYLIGDGEHGELEARTTGDLAGHRNFDADPALLSLGALLVSYDNARTRPDPYP